MRKAYIAIAAAVVIVAAVALFAVPARAQFARPDDVRFQLIGDEPIVAPDGRQFVTNWKVVVLRDRRSDQCYLGFVGGNSAMSITGPAACPTK